MNIIGHALGHAFAIALRLKVKPVAMSLCKLVARRSRHERNTGRDYDAQYATYHAMVDALEYWQIKSYEERGR